MANRLIDSTSPYLLQHANNPVDWYPWGAEALGRAKGEGKPIFLSIGYAACHWCHVMEHLVFERPDIAAVMNEHFINIKVDREERPDLDELYMLATQLMTGQGGWPMSVWLTPELEPFYAGTYFPPEDGYGRPGFPRLLLALADAWKNRRGELLEQSKRVVEAIKLHADESKNGTRMSSAEADSKPVGEGRAGDGSGGPPIASWLRLAVEQSADRFDEVHGGPSGAPKFPPHQMLLLWSALLESGTEKKIITQAEQGVLAEKVAKTLDGMMNGGIYDHVGGGFARYSTDEEWLVPHFEKMLYDSAQLAPVYAAASVQLNVPDYARVARETLDFYMREMMSAEGVFYSSLDADSEGEEGKYYVWTLEDVRAALPDAREAELVIRYFDMKAEGNWAESPVAGGSVLATQNRTRRSSAEAHSKPVSEGPNDAAYLNACQKLDAAILKLRAFRVKRERPRLDDKILTAWNGLMISALVLTGRYLREAKYRDAGARLAEFLLTKHMHEGHLLRVSRNGNAHTDAFLDDHAFLLNGLMDLIDEAGAASPFLARAKVLAETMLRDFQDAEHGGFFFTGPRHEQLFARMKNAADNATPSANGVAIRALLRLSAVTSDAKYRDAALKAIAAFEENIARRPAYFPTLLVGLLESGLPPGVSDAEEEQGVSDSGVFRLTFANVRQLDVAHRMEFEITYHLSVKEGYHLQPADKSEAGMTKTAGQLRIVGQIGNDALAQEWIFPEPVEIHGTRGFAGMIELKARFVLNQGGRMRVRATVTGQACSTRACLAPESVTFATTLDLGGR